MIQSSFIPIPERETTIKVNIDPETQIMDGVKISPHSFSQEALKQIIRSKIFAERPKNMRVEKKHATSCWSSSWIKGLRYNYRGRDRLEKIKALALELKRADKIIFEEPYPYET